ncbi:2'-5' RNA ligase [Paenibacillus algicola]|uniref:RNA 2',3'-cyclic phosphodiesterase n=1 Tax=Paenibacillus algicola TaxID=2565926 RepID=A0A4P8XPA8_9BACL|nr:RNA 2',3'-cyclic phosphodiesterase [Paenibacillus algicola]QCT04105.1 2'-5' RNA ligase [Paenibacillus algicola]
MNAADRSSVMRLFVALPLPREAAGAMLQWTQELKEHLSFRKWVHPQDYHITLQFLGDLDPEMTASVVSSLSSVAVIQKPFSLTLGKGGVFGLAASPRVMWTGVDGDLKELQVLQQRVTASMAALGLKPEERPYRPHITAARKFIDGRIPIPCLEQGPERVRFTADALVLYRTVMGASPMYEVQERAAFSG